MKFNPETIELTHNEGKGEQLGRYAENWHQPGWFIPDLDSIAAKEPTFASSEQVFGKELGNEIGYNNIIDFADGALKGALLFRDDKKVFANVIKHTNACGAATGDTSSGPVTTPIVNFLPELGQTAS